MTKNQGFRMEADAENATMYVYEAIGEDWWGGGVTASKVSKELAALGSGVKTITVKINSPGGDVFDAITIHNLLRQHRAQVVVSVDGLAASAASVIAMAGDRIEIADNAMLMIHNPWSAVAGNSADMRKMAETLDKIKDTLVMTYQGRTKADRTQISQWMDDETWMSGAEAVDRGFADAVIAGHEASSINLGKFAAHYRNAPAARFDASSAWLQPVYDEVVHLRRRLDLLVAAS